MSGHEPTPRLSVHARERCQEMGVCTKRVKAIVRCPDLDYVTYDHKGDARLAWRKDDPGIAAIYVIEDGQPVVLTVVPRTYETYVRVSA